MKNLIDFVKRANWEYIERFDTAYYMKKNDEESDRFSHYLVVIDSIDKADTLYCMKRLMSKDVWITESEIMRDHNNLNSGAKRNYIKIINEIKDTKLTTITNDTDPFGYGSVRY